jgi:hypothetical protein
MAPALDASLAPSVPSAFRHALFREVLYERIGPLARQQLHRTVGMALEREKGAGTQSIQAESVQALLSSPEVC